MKVNRIVDPNPLINKSRSEPEHALTIPKVRPYACHKYLSDSIKA